MHRVAITGIGACTPYGRGVEALWNGIKEGRSALQYCPELKFVVGRIDFDSPDFDRWTKGEKREMSKASLLALLAAEEALQSANAVDINHTDTLVNIGTGVSDLEYIGDTVKLVRDGQSRRVSPYFVPRILNNLPAGYVAMKYKMMGGAESASTACATGVHCIGNAFHSIRHGWSRKAIAGATEAAVSPTGIAGFDRMRALARGDSPSISRPFDRKRAGFVMSEGSGLLFMERLEDAQERGANILAEVVGYGISSDCHHISAPHPSGIGGILCMRRAIQDARLTPSDIGYVNAHATSTPTGDAIETTACREVYGKQANMAVSSVKGHLGHLLAAAGAVETIATVFSVREGLRPGNLNLEDTDLGEELRVLRENEPWSDSSRVAVVNSFGFGGTNASIVLRNFKLSI